MHLLQGPISGERETSVQSPGRNNSNTVKTPQTINIVSFNSGPHSSYLMQFFLFVCCYSGAFFFFFLDADLNDSYIPFFWHR